MAEKIANTGQTAGPVVVGREDDIHIDPTSASHSIYVTGFPATTKSEDLIIHFQRKKNGGGDIGSITISKPGAAVITFDSPEVVQSVLQQKQKFEGVVLTVEPYVESTQKDDQNFEVFELVSAELCLETVEFLTREQTSTLLKEIADKTGITWFESSENFMMSGTFKQVEVSRIYLQQAINQSGGIAVFNGLTRKNAQKGEENESRFVEEEMEEDLDHSNSRTNAMQKEVPHQHQEPNEKHTNHLAGPEIQHFEVEPKFIKVFVKAYEAELKDIEAEYQVEIPREAKGGKVTLKPKGTCSTEQYDKACDLFIDLYQQMTQNIKKERFSLKSEKDIIPSRKKIQEIGKKFPVSVELSRDRKHWELYGEARDLEAALEFLKKEKVEIKRETAETAKSTEEFQESRDHEEEMDVDPPHSSRVVRSKDLLETYIGKVKVSVYKGDLTREQVDVIVNAANDRLRHDGGVAQAILNKGGKVIGKESNRIIQQRGPLKGGEAVYTKAGKLPCKMVVHAVGPEFLNVGLYQSKIILRRACLNSLTIAQKSKMTSIALPAIGSGIYAMPKDACAEVMFDAVEEFVRQGDSKEKSITDVRFVNIDDSAVQAFRKEFISRYENNQEHPKSNKLAGGESVKFPPTGAEGGSSMTPRSDRGKNRKKNGSGNTRATTNPSNVGAGHHHDAAFGSSAANNDHPLRDSSHPSSSTTTYSGAVKNTPGSNDARPSRVQEPGGAEGSNTGFHLPSGRKEAATDRKDEGKKDNASKRSIILIAISGGEHMSLKQGFPATTLTTLKDPCPICLDTMTSPRILKCKHAFCSECLKRALDTSNKCPVCQEPQGVLQGNQPPGEMRNRFEHYSVPGYEGCGAIIIEYYFPPGIQGSQHPNPGQWFESTSRMAYLPNTQEGREVLHLLRRAFDARLLFTVGTSNTTGRANQITWNDVHHKTSLSGGPYRFGYPDPDYLRRVKEELAAKGIR